MPRLQRLAQVLLLRVELAQAGFDQAQLAFALLQELGRLHESGIDALTLRGDLVEVGLQVLAAALRGVQPAAVAFEAFAGLVLAHATLRRRE